MPDSQETMVERVARAIGGLEFRVVVAATNGHEHDAAKVIARAAIAAMREPTEAMIASGIVQADECTDGWSASAACVAEHVWLKMIQAALSEGVEG